MRDVLIERIVGQGWDVCAEVSARQPINAQAALPTLLLAAPPPPPRSPPHPHRV
jgi:hypothetical protein